MVLDALHRLLPTITINKININLLNIAYKSQNQYISSMFNTQPQ